MHHETVAPHLAAKQLTATFNICAHEDFTKSTHAWKRVASLGHELGNHTLFHPCRQEPELNYSWLDARYDLRDYSARQWMDEMRVANCLLNLIDGAKDRTFGNTCCHTTIGRGATETKISDLIAPLFVAGRGPLNNQIIRPSSLFFPALGHFNGDGKTFTELRQSIERSISLKGWIIFMFHGVGEGTHSGYADAVQHAKLIDYLDENSRHIWTASMVNVARHLKSKGFDSTQNKSGSTL